MAEPLSYQEAGPQSCYRHPGRETGVRCTRCDRPICPECMTPAAVGFQCPECVKEGRKTVRQPRTLTGARVSADSPVTRILLGINVVIFALYFVSNGQAIDFGRFVQQTRVIAFDGEYYRLISSAFFHTSPLHIMFNMYALLLLGDAVERQLGRWRYVALYLGSGLAGGAASYVWSGPFDPGSIGASGAIFGLFGALFVIQRRMRADTSQIMVVLVLNLVIGFVVPNIDWRAHLGGLVAGALITAGYIYIGRGAQRAPLHAAVVAVVVALTVGVISARTTYLKDRCAQFGLCRAEGSAQPVKAALPETAVAAGATGIARSAFSPPPSVASVVGLAVAAAPATAVTDNRCVSYSVPGQSV
jgi:membrane associated rhomboid family serine protease